MGDNSATGSNEKLCYFFRIEKLGYKLDFISVNHHTTLYIVPACFTKLLVGAGDQHMQAAITGEIVVPIWCVLTVVL
jgi:hypothetical protein